MQPKSKNKNIIREVTRTSLLAYEAKAIPISLELVVEFHLFACFLNNGNFAFILYISVFLWQISMFPHTFT